MFATHVGRNAVVTGASTGIGRATALEMARAGARVVVHCNRSIVKASEVVAQISAEGSDGRVIECDLSEVAACESLVTKAFDVLGSVDVWVNNAGVDLLTGDAADLGFAEKLECLFEVDVRATLLLSRLVGERMRTRGSGTIVNIGWDQADRGMEGNSGELFAASKNAVMGFTRSLAVSLAPEVRVNCVAPGWVRTAWGEQASEEWQQRVADETLLKRWGTPEDIARAIRFLSSDEAGWITGQVINVNGGAVR